jgi:preprotein translocase SecE subunit
MAVAESPVAEKTKTSAQPNLGVSALAGGALVLLALWFIFGGFPYLWTEVIAPKVFADAAGKVNDFLSAALLLIASALWIAVLAILGYAQLRRIEFPGLRAGIFYSALALFLTAALTIWFGNKMGGLDIDVGLARKAIVAVAGLALLAGVVWVFTRQGFQNWLVHHEGSGWFSGVSFKPNQGVRVRRWTIIGVLTIGLSGIYVMVHNGLLGADRREPVPGSSEPRIISNDWMWRIPFTTTTADEDRLAGKTLTAELEAQSRSLDGYRYIPLMYKVHLFAPVILAVLLVWFAWRLVNQPTFADFLIATEAEMNKVSWTTRKRLVQDTVVVLVTVVLMTLFLFAIDLLWIWGLTATGVLQKDTRAEQFKQRQKTGW